MLLREYISARDHCFRVEVFISLRASGMADARADAIVEEAFARAAGILKKITAPAILEAVNHIELSPREERHAAA